MAFPVTPTRDSTWIATKALSRIGASSVDNPPSAEDLALALDALDATVANLQGRGIIYIADLDSVPSGVAQELSDALARDLLPDFGDLTGGQSSIPPQAQIDANLKRIMADVPSYGPQKVSYF